MTHLPYLVAAYGLGVLMPATYAIGAFLRLRTARRRLATIDPRLSGPGPGPRRRVR